MSRGFARRLDQLEDRLVIGEKRQEFERLRRWYFNLRMVSDKALQVAESTLQEKVREPDWVRYEFEKPIPQDATPWLVREAEAKARMEMSL